MFFIKTCFGNIFLILLTCSFTSDAFVGYNGRKNTMINFQREIIVAGSDSIILSSASSSASDDDNNNNNKDKESAALEDSSEEDEEDGRERERIRQKKKPLLEFRINDSIGSIVAEDWNTCAESSGGSPFMEHSFLFSLEESGCVSAKHGWIPKHISIVLDGKVCGYVPMYIKDNSWGEFIFDNGWAEAALNNGIRYYPKLLVGVPFTPVTSQRILLHPSIIDKLSRKELKQLRTALGEFLKQVAKSNRISSVHFNFITDDEATDLSSSSTIGENNRSYENQKVNNKDSNNRQPKKTKLTFPKDTYLRRTSLQYHWSNANRDDKPYESFDEYLSCFKSRKRIKIKRERQVVLKDGNIRIDAIVGKNILLYDGLVERMFEIYLSTINRMILVGSRQYLNKELLQMLAKSDFVKNLVFLCARSKDAVAGDDDNHEDGDVLPLRADDVFAGTINIVKNDTFFGRYWGCLPGREVKNLHFETCYWSAIEYCIKNGLKRMEPGAGGGDYKWARGFDPTLIHSVHYICNAGLRLSVSQFLEYETKNNIEVMDYLRTRSVVRRK